MKTQNYSKICPPQRYNLSFETEFFLLIQGEMVLEVLY